MKVMSWHEECTYFECQENCMKKYFWIFPMILAITRGCVYLIKGKRE